LVLVSAARSGQHALPKRLGVKGLLALIVENEELDSPGGLSSILRQFTVKPGLDFKHVLHVPGAGPSAAEGGDRFLAAEPEGLIQELSHESVTLWPPGQIS
jgi:hypothetical protein